MNDFNGTFTAGRDMNVASGDINIYENKETYKAFTQMLPNELRAERLARRKRLKTEKSKNISKAPKWLTLPALGTFLGIYFLMHVQELLNHNISLSRLFDLFVYFSNSYPPYILIPSVIGYLFILWILPAFLIFDLLFKDNEVMRRHRKAIHDISILLAEKG